MRLDVARRVHREPAVLATALAGACGPVVIGLLRQRDQVPVRDASLVGAVLGLGIGAVARRRTWSADRVEDDLIDAEMALSEDAL